LKDVNLGFSLKRNEESPIALKLKVQERFLDASLSAADRQATARSEYPAITYAKNE